jgi:hypothetical protein
MMEDEPKTADLWNNVLGAVLALPGARVDRAEFLRRELSKHFPTEVVEQAIESRPALAGIPSSSIRSIAQSCIAWHRAGVSAVSFTAGLPGGWWIAGTVPADLTQFFWHVVVVLQKLAYLHGWPDLTSNDGDLDDETRLTLTVFVGVMLGAEASSRLFRELGDRVGEQLIRRLPQNALTKWGLFQFAKQVAKWIGLRLTKQSFARFVARAIPGISGFIAGAITWMSFSAMSKRLRMHLEGLMLAKSQLPAVLPPEHS